jgi:hypothetical protein
MTRRVGMVSRSLLDPSKMLRRPGLAGRLGVVASAAALAAGLSSLPIAAPPALATTPPSIATTSYEAMVYLGTTNLQLLEPSASAVTPSVAPSSGQGGFELVPEPNPPTGRVASPQPISPLVVPPATNATISSNPSGFDGITGAQQAMANGGGPLSDLEPPDQGLCSNGTDIVEVVNNAYAVYGTDGSTILAPVATPGLFSLPSIDQGTFISDPRCYWDQSTGHWFVTEISIPNLFTDPQAATHASQLVAVSATSDPTGSYVSFEFDTTDLSDPGCPCFGDYDMIGADANGFYITTNEFGISSGAFNGAQLYAISKQGLAQAASHIAVHEVWPIPKVTHFSNLASPFPGETAGETYHLSPALTPADGTYDAAKGGTELFTMSDAFPLSSDQMGVLALTNTSSLSSFPPDLNLSETAVDLAQSYRFPPTTFAVHQESAAASCGSSPPAPLRCYVKTKTGTLPPEGVLQADFDAVEETTYADGELFTELSSASCTTSCGSIANIGPVGTTSAEWFILSPFFSGGTVQATELHGGVLVAKDGSNVTQSLLYPDIVVDGQSGTGDMVFTVAGSSYFPSAAYIAFGNSGPTGDIEVAAAGSGPEDGFTCYAYFVKKNYGGCRWGDFSGGVAAGGSIWMATEYIPPNSGATARDMFTNWGTHIFTPPPIV